jgi:hypothetical protein
LLFGHGISNCENMPPLRGFELFIAISFYNHVSPSGLHEMMVPALALKLSAQLLANPEGMAWLYQDCIGHTTQTPKG